jgi:hypothetical protein
MTGGRRFDVSPLTVGEICLAEVPLVAAKTGPDATPSIGLDLGRQIFDDPGDSDRQEERTDPGEERIRQRAHEIWESEGCSGDPQDHWVRAERELSGTMQERSEATVEDAPPAAAAGAAEAVGTNIMSDALERVAKRGSSHDSSRRHGRR